MTDCTVKKYPKYGQRLRFPNNSDRILMACPTFGNKFYSDFELISLKKGVRL
jgi:hypothetical protein